MKTTLEYVAAIKARYNVSDYKLAPLLGLSRSAVSSYRNKNVTFDDRTAMRAAELLGLDAGEVLANIHAERAKDAAVRKAWQSIARRMRHATAAALGAAILSALMVGGFAYPDRGLARVGDVTAVTIMRSRARLARLLQWLARTLGPQGLGPPAATAA